MATETRIGTKIKRAREDLRWTQQQLADAIGVNRKTVDNWENNRTYPRSSIGALERALGVALTADAGSRDDQLKEIEELRRRLETLASEIRTDDEGQSRPRAG